MANINSLDSVYFIKLPEDYKISDAAFPVDITIPLPVQKKDDDSPGNFYPDELTEEQILSGILTVLAHDWHNPHNEYYRSIIKKIRPNLKKELSDAAIIKAKNEDWELAEEIFTSLRAVFPDDMIIVLNTALFLDNRASFCRQSGLIEDADAYDSDALAYYLDAMDADPPIPDAYFNAGYFYLKQSEYAKAKDCMETYIALTCDTADEELGENGIWKKEQAQILLNEIKNQNMDDARFSDAYRMISNHEEEKGVDKIREFLQRNPKVWNAWFLLGWGLRLMGRFDDARQSFAQSLACEGGENNADTFNEIAICCMEAGDFSEAQKNLERALRLSPENTKILSNLGCIAMKNGDATKAASYFMSVLEFSPNDPIAKSQLEILEHL